MGGVTPRQTTNNTDWWHLREAGRFSYDKSPRTPPLKGTSLHRRNYSVERPCGILSQYTKRFRSGRIHTARVCNTDKWHRREAGLFSYCESWWTSPIEGTSLHRRNNTVGRSRGNTEPVYDLVFAILSYFTPGT